MFSVKYKKLTCAMYFVCPKILDVSPILAICNFNVRATLYQAEIVKMGDDPTGGINLKCI